MSRPKPDIIIEKTDPETYLTEQILEASGTYAVFYDGRPINVRTVNKLIPSVQIKYRRSAFSNPGHAKLLATQLNQEYNTDKFTAVLLDQGRPLED